MLPKDAHASFEQRLIAMGKLLPDARAPKNLFADVRMEIEAEMENLPAELVVRVGVPGMAALFAGRIKAGIEERLGGLLTVQPA